MGYLPSLLETLGIKVLEKALEHFSPISVIQILIIDLIVENTLLTEFNPIPCSNNQSQNCPASLEEQADKVLSSNN